eukprot:CAMPEP_0114977052 /NCGR_PEP_ID=MMETSP0216-20121206/3020_1 /TAXON_ID=223996 /ORGANISM="Protocruzia adherens, Strain Boccale" /LENGTH=143 /DNA_ID=CAMNT_0002338061 /DNA_START=836 /DNA_END=1267 /DNA_ORIENTATION=+
MKHIITWNIENIIHSIGCAYNPSNNRTKESLLKGIGTQSNILCSSLLLIKQSLQDLNLPPDQLQSHLEEVGVIALNMYDSTTTIAHCELGGAVNFFLASGRNCFLCRQHSRNFFSYLSGVTIFGTNWLRLDHLSGVDGSYTFF